MRSQDHLRASDAVNFEKSMINKNKKYSYNPFQYEWMVLLDKFVFTSENKLYSLWIYYLSLLSLIQSLFYTHFMAFGIDENLTMEWFLVIAVCEGSFLINILVECFKAYDKEGVIEMRFKMTSRKFTRSLDFHIQAFNQIPFALLGNFEQTSWLRCLVLFKILRIRLFLRIFQYKNYHKFF